MGPQERQPERPPHQCTSFVNCKMNESLATLHICNGKGLQTIYNMERIEGARNEGKNTFHTLKKSRPQCQSYIFSGQPVSYTFQCRLPLSIFL